MESPLGTLPYRLCNVIYSENSLDKRIIIGLIYLEKLTFDGANFQTAKINSFVNIIFLIKRELGNKKKPTRKQKVFKCRFCDLDEQIFKHFYR